MYEGIRRSGAMDPVWFLTGWTRLKAVSTATRRQLWMEVLDPEQNTTFLNHYVDLPAIFPHILHLHRKYLEPNPAAFVDRMENDQTAGLYAD